MIRVSSTAWNAASITIDGYEPVDYAIVGSSIYRVSPDRPGSSGRQVCVGLGYRGDTMLVIEAQPDLAAMLRGEIRRAKRRGCDDLDIAGQIGAVEFGEVSP